MGIADEDGHSEFRRLQRLHVVVAALLAIAMASGAGVRDGSGPDGAGPTPPGFIGDGA